jgi:hypothetical protein
MHSPATINPTVSVSKTLPRRPFLRNLKLLCVAFLIDTMVWIQFKINVRAYTPWYALSFCVPYNAVLFALYV